PLRILVVLMDVARSVAVAHVETAVGSEGDVCGRVRCTTVIDPRLLRQADAPDDMAVERHLCDLVILDVAHVQEFFLALLADSQAVAASMELLAERANELALLIEDRDGVHRIPGSRLMREIDQPAFIEDHAVRVAPMDMRGERAPVVRGLVGIRTRAEDRQTAARLVAGSDERRTDGRRCSGRSGRGEELPAREFMATIGRIASDHRTVSRGDENCSYYSRQKSSPGKYGR